MGSPRQVLRQLPRAVTKFSTTSTMQVLDRIRQVAAAGEEHAATSAQARSGHHDAKRRGLSDRRWTPRSRRRQRGR